MYPRMAVNGYVISYIEVTATTARDGDVQFAVVRGKTGEKNLVFHLASNNSDFLTYSYLAYGIREEDYKKMANIVTLPMKNNSKRLEGNLFTSLMLILISIKSIFF
ncbi:unnamed protein product [Colias eurytheme]|nr:unnamed protein product [Colias eurytheme]